MKKLIITSIILTLSFSLNAQSWWNSKRVSGNGDVTTITRNTSDYDAVSLGGAFDVVLVKGKEGKITIEGEENLLKYITTEVKSGVLKINVEKGINMRMTKKMTITVPYSDIEKVSLGGSGDLTSTGTIKADAFSISLAGSGNIDLDLDAKNVSSKIAGSGNIKLKGNATELNCSITGSGNINAYDLKTEETSANITGSGNVKTTVSNKITAKVVGSGTIYYKGKPEYIDSKSVGSGSIVSKN